MSKEELNFYLKSFCTSARKKGGTSVYESSSVEPSESRQLIVSFARRRSTIKPFSIISDPAFTEENKALEHL